MNLVTSMMQIKSLEQSFRLGKKKPEDEKNFEKGFENIIL